MRHGISQEENTKERKLLDLRKHGLNHFFFRDGRKTYADYLLSKFLRKFVINYLVDQLIT